MTILIAEDDEDDFFFTARMLKKATDAALFAAVALLASFAKAWYLFSISVAKGYGRFGIGDTGFAGSNISLRLGHGRAERFQIRRRGQPCQPFGQALCFGLGPGSAGGGGGSSIAGGAGSGRSSRMGGHRIRQGGFGGQGGGLRQR